MQQIHICNSADATLDALQMMQRFFLQGKLSFKGRLEPVNKQPIDLLALFNGGCKFSRMAILFQWQCCPSKLSRRSLIAHLSKATGIVPHVGTRTGQLMLCKSRYYTIYVAVGRLNVIVYSTCPTPPAGMVTGVSRTVRSNIATPPAELLVLFQ